MAGVGCGGIFVIRAQRCFFEGWARRCCQAVLLAASERGSEASDGMLSASGDGGRAPWSRLEGLAVLVMGASSDIGRKFCLDLARVGCQVVAAARRADGLLSLSDEINASALAATGVPRAVAVELMPPPEDPSWTPWCRGPGTPPATSTSWSTTLASEVTNWLYGNPGCDGRYNPLPLLLLLLVEEGSRAGNNQTEPPAPLAPPPQGAVGGSPAAPPTPSPPWPLTPPLPPVLAAAAAGPAAVWRTGGGCSGEDVEAAGEVLAAGLRARPGRRPWPGWWRRSTPAAWSAVCHGSWGGRGVSHDLDLGAYLLHIHASQRGSAGSGGDRPCVDRLPPRCGPSA